MKRLITILIMVFFSVALSAQTSNTYKYQVKANGGLSIGINGIKIDSIKKLSDKIYFYSGVNTWSSDTLNGIASLNNVIDVDNTIIQLDANVAHKGIYQNTYVGNRAGGHAMYRSVTQGSMLNVRNRLMNDHGVAMGVNSIVDGYMTVSAGTNTVGSGNDSFVSGNESVIGRRLYFNISFERDGGGNYIAVNGASYAGVYSTIPAYGDQSSYFVSAIDSTGYTYASRAFWSYPVIFTNMATKNYPAGVTIGPNPIIVTSVSYDAENNKTKVYINDSLNYAPGTVITGGNWITSGRRGVPGTGMFAGGKYSSVAAEQGTAFGNKNNVWAAYAFGAGVENTVTGRAGSALGGGQYVTGTYGAAFNSKNTVTGSNAVAFNSSNIVGGAKSAVFGFQNKSNYEDVSHVIYGGGKFTVEGDNQAGFYTSKYALTGAGWQTLILSTPQPNASYTATTNVVCTQVGGTVGEIGESGSWELKWGLSVGDEYKIDSINLTTDTIYFNSAVTLPVNQRLAFNTYTNSGKTSETTLPAGINLNRAYFVKYSGPGKITISATPGGGLHNITGFDNTLYNMFVPWSVNGSVQTLIGRTFVNDGDDIGDGTTTGIRCSVATTPYRLAPFITIYSLANRNTRWVASTNYVMVKSK